MSKPQRTKHVVIAGPCVSEFGWELMEYQAYVRRLVRGAADVVVCSTAGLEPLYADMQPTYIAHTIKCTRDAHKLRQDTLENPEELARVQALLQARCKAAKKRGRRVIRLDDTKGKLQRRAISDQLFVKYGNAASAPVAFKLVVHARDRHDTGPCGGDNYSRDDWMKLLELLAAAGLVSSRAQIASIGTKDAALALPSTVDMRGIPLQQLMDILAAAELVIGPSSGPMHLASLCGTPHFVWATSRHQPVIGRGNLERYMTYWNPLKTPVCVVPHPKGRQPEASVLADACCEFAAAYISSSKSFEGSSNGDTSRTA